MTRRFGPLMSIALVRWPLSGKLARAQQECSVSLIESSRFMRVPFGALVPGCAFVPDSRDPEL